MDTVQMKRKLFRLMAKLDPVKLNSTGKLDAAVAALIILDQTTDHRYVVKFLSKGFAEDWARLMVTQQVAQVNPYTFHFHAQLGWIVWASVLKNCNSLEGVLKVPCEISHCDSDDLHAELGWRGEDCQRPQVRAFVAVGDQLHLRSSPRDWWTVHEFRPRLNSVLLVARDQKRGGRKVHYREVHTLALMGCTVRRSLCVPCFRQSLCACECGEARRHSCVFQFPSPDSSAAVALIESASEGGRDGCSAALGLLHGDDEAFCSAEDQVRRMQREAGVRCWLKHKRGVAQAKAAMQALPPACSLNRTVWVTAARALRALSPGNNTELFSLWRQWTLLPATKNECSAVWDSLRPPSNCDEPALVRARHFVQQGLQKRQGGGTGDPGRDLVSRSIVADADLLLRRAVLEFWADSDVGSGEASSPRKRAAVGRAAPLRRALVVPAAVYTFDPAALRFQQDQQELLFEVQQQGEKMHLCPAEAAVISGQFEELRDVQACVAPGCVLGLRGEGGPHEWVRVLRVDLLFARLRVCACLPPPHPWLGEADPRRSSEKDDVCGIWLSVSKLWSALVCSRAEAGRGVARYCMFTAPLPDPSTCLAALLTLASSAEDSEQRGAGAGEALLRVLHCDPCSITVAWSFPGDDEYKQEEGEEESTGGRGRLHVLGCAVDCEVSVRLSERELLGPWQQVYRGRGRGCSISGLRCASAYHVRLVMRSSCADSRYSGSSSYILTRTTTE